MNKKLFSILLLGFVNGLGFSLFLPMLPFLVEDLGQGVLFFGLLASVYSLGQFFAAPVLGAMSDRIGRKKLLIWSQFGTLMSLLLFAGSLFLPHREVFGVSLPLRGILLARLLDGITGGNNSVAQAYLADITDPKKRSKRFGLFAAMMIGPAIGGWISAFPRGYVLTVLAAVVVSVFALFFLIFFLEETVEVTHSIQKITLKDFHVFKNFTLLRSVPKLQKRFFVYGIFMMAFIGFISLNLLYAKDVLGFTQTGIGTMYFVVGATMIFHQTISLRFLTKKISDKWLFILGVIITGFCLLVYRTRPDVSVFFGNIFFLTLGLSLSMSSFKSIISNLVPKHEQGKVIGLDESFAAASRAIVPMIATSLYAVISYRVFGWFGLLLFLGVGSVGVILWKRKSSV